MITAAIVTGSLAGRVKFGAMTAFLGIWLLVVYAPLATWFGAAMVPLSATSSARSTLPAATWYTFRPVSRADSLLNARPSSRLWHGELPSA